MPPSIGVLRRDLVASGDGPPAIALAQVAVVGACVALGAARAARRCLAQRRWGLAPRRWDRVVARCSRWPCSLAHVGHVGILRSPGGCTSPNPFCSHSRWPCNSGWRRSGGSSWHCRHHGEAVLRTSGLRRHLRWAWSHRGGSRRLPVPHRVLHRGEQRRLQVWRIASLCWSIMYSVTPVGNICCSWRYFSSMITVARPSVRDLVHSAMLPTFALSNTGVTAAGAADDEKGAAGDAYSEQR